MERIFSDNYWWKLGFCFVFQDIGHSALVDAIEIMLSTLAKSQILIAYLPQVCTSNSPVLSN